MDENQNKWYFNGLTANPYYTPFKVNKRIAHYAPPGDRIPTPKEIAEYFNLQDRVDYSNGVFYTWEDVVDSGERKDVPGGTYWYLSDTANLPERITPFDLREDRYLPVSGILETISTELKTFLVSEKIYHELGSFWKTGLLAYGEPGNSKTMGIRHLIKTVIPEDTITIFIPGELPSSEFLFKIKETLDDRLKVFVFEEFSTGMSDKYQVASMLTFLDGELSPDRCIIIATTNYPEALPGNLVNRPSRFDKLFKFDNPDDAARKTFIQFFTGRDVTESEIVSSKGLSVAAIKEACIRSRLNNISLLAVFKTLKDRTKLCEKAFAKPVKEIGFGASDLEFGDDCY